MCTLISIGAECDTVIAIHISNVSTILRLYFVESDIYVCESVSYLGCTVLGCTVSMQHEKALEKLEIHTHEVASSPSAPQTLIATVMV